MPQCPAIKASMDHIYADVDKNFTVVMTTLEGILNFDFGDDLCIITLKPDDGGGDHTIAVPRFKMKWVVDAMREYGDIT